MARSRSRSAVRGKPVSVPRPVQKAALYSTTLDVNSPPRRRWTRSQSREVESHQQSRDGGGGGGESGKGWGKRRGDIESEFILFFVTFCLLSVLRVFVFFKVLIVCFVYTRVFV